MVYKSHEIFIAYRVSNISIRLVAGGINFDTVEYWLASMGMLETLIIMGVKAEIWEKWDEHHGR